MEGLISVIVPVYNAAAYLEECVESVLKQSYPHFEVLLVDDGSQDGSIALCEGLCAKDKRLRLLRQEHRGVSAARNRAMEAANGEYLFFLDSDDAIHPKLLETLLELAASTGAAVIMEGHCRIPSQELHEVLLQAAVCEEAMESTYISNPKLLEQFLHGQAPRASYALGGKLICRSVVTAYRFDEQLCNAEDTKLIYQLIANGADAAVLKKDWYYYRMHPDSASERHSVSMYQALYACQEFICEHEKESGRLQNARYRELVITNRILEWYRQSRRMRDGEIKKYLKVLAEAERKKARFQWLSHRDREMFYLAFHCRVLYQSILWWRGFKTKRRAGEK